MLQEAVVIPEMPVSARTDVYLALPAEIESAVATIMLAFSADPIARWVYPDPGDYARYFPAFIRAFGGRAFEFGSAYVTPDFAGASLWLPPGVEPDSDALSLLVETSVSESIKPDLHSVMKEMADFHPAEPHWYLPMIGVDTMRQNSGVGSALMAFAASQLDAENAIGYLESSNPRNIPLYERFGFEVIGEIRHGKSAPLFPMLRRPK
jgi:ribosomal protein S18 acetylase RimI-like enzyme